MANRFAGCKRKRSGLHLWAGRRVFAGDVACAVDGVGADDYSAKLRAAAVSVSADVAGLVAGAVVGDVTCAVDGAGADADAAKVSGVPPS